ncbi:MAG: HIT domain-containing protein [Actinomycetota bacterium]|nr:HIT domain-containing protein [Actinomycetota bacterium]
MVADCLFCAIVAGDIPADIVRADTATVAFRDTNPQAPTHVLIVPREHVSDLTAIGSDPEVAAGLLAGIAATALELGLSAYRTVFNTGADVGQSVFHVHAHVLAGRSFGWPPG